MLLGKAWEVTRELSRLGEEHGVQKAMEADLAYLQKHEDNCRMDYALYRQRGLPIGSGAVESAIRRVINLRVKGPGLLWYEHNAEGMILMRAAALTGRWQELVDNVRHSSSTDRRIDVKWASPDMRAELEAGTDVHPPTPQVQGVQQPSRRVA
jgi:hypothetical protein